MLLALSLLACNESKIPEDALFYDVTVQVENNDDDPLVDECHPDLTDVPGYQETFSYAVAFEGSKATLYIDEAVYAIGTITGCELTYSTVVYGSDTEADGPVKWQIFGGARVDPTEGDACVEGEDDWEGWENIEIVSSEEETLEPGCQYEMTTLGGLVAG